MKSLFTPVLLLLSLWNACQSADFRQSRPGLRIEGKVNGLTLVAPPEPFSINPIPAMQDVGANWVALIPYAFTRKSIPQLRFNEHGGQWWGESPAGIAESVRLAHEAKMKVMLKPQVWMPGAWTGGMEFGSDADWQSWETGYERYILHFARMADSLGIELFCVGTEFRAAIEQRPQFWRNLIQKVRNVYEGPLTYSANWDDWDKVPFWAELDYIGLGGYFPLLPDATPSVAALQESWKPIRERLGRFSEQQQRPVLFTEWGYLSVDSCGWRNWELERDIRSRNINQVAQANCMEAMLATFQTESWWAGGFLWKWFPNMRGHEGYPERDYTPQGKKAAETLQRLFK